MTRGTEKRSGRPEAKQSMSTIDGSQPNNPLHGVTLETIVTELVEAMGWELMGERVRIRCFQSEPSVSSSLKFLRRTPWARAEVERLYLERILRRR